MATSGLQSDDYDAIQEMQFENELSNDTWDTEPIAQLMRLEENNLVVPINGFITPVVVLVTLVTNCIVCAVLLRPHMRSPTNALLVAIATSDMLTGVWSVPGYVYFYAGGAYREWVSYRWCFVYQILTEYIPTMFHTASIWLTVALAVQRYVYVCHALSARQLCTTSNFVRVIVAILAAAFVSQTSRFFEYSYAETEVPSLVYPTEVSYPQSRNFLPNEIFVVVENFIHQNKLINCLPAV